MLRVACAVRRADCRKREKICRPQVVVVRDAVGVGPHSSLPALFLFAVGSHVFYFRLVFVRCPRAQRQAITKAVGPRARVAQF
jgi:hypothetical protein